MDTEPRHVRPQILIAGYGDLGQAVGGLLLAEGWSVVGLNRSGHSPNNAIMRTGDVTRPATLTTLQDCNPDILLYCVAATEQSDDNYRAHYVEGLRNVLDATAHAKRLRHVFFVSSTRVYGQKTEALLSEVDPARPADFGGVRLLEAEQLLAALPVRHTVLRLSGIYGPGRLRMVQLARQPERWPANAWSNRIHRDDAARFIAWLVQQSLAGKAVDDCYLVTDSCPVPQHNVLNWLANQMGLENQAATEVSGGKRLSNTRMLQTGFTLRYPDYRAGYATLLQEGIS